MATTRLILVILLVVAVFGCKKASQEERAKELFSEATSLLKQSTKLTGQWTDEYQKTFATENRAKFPGNREWLRAQADTIINILDECSNVERRMIAKYEESGPLFDKEEDRQGVSLIVTAFRKNLEVNEMLKAQMRLVSDEQIKDEKTLNERIKQSWQQIQQKQEESENQYKEGKRLMSL